MSLLATFSLASSQSARAPSSRNRFTSSSLVRGATLQTSRMYTDRGSLGSWVSMRVASASSIIVETRWDEKAGLRRDAVRSQVIDALEAQMIHQSEEESTRLRPAFSWKAFTLRARPVTRLTCAHARAGRCPLP